MAPEAPDWLVRKVFALYKAAGATAKDDRLKLTRWVLWNPAIRSTDDCSRIELQAVADVLGYWQRTGDLACRCREILSGPEPAGGTASLHEPQ